MTTERWDDERLDRLAEMVQSVTEGLAETRQIVASLAQEHGRTRDMVNSNARVIQLIANAIGEAAEERAEAKRERQQILELIAQQQQTINEQQSEIRGLQRENRVMIENWLNQQNRDDNPDAS